MSGISLNNINSDYIEDVYGARKPNNLPIKIYENDLISKLESYELEVLFLKKRLNNINILKNKYTDIYYSSFTHKYMLPKNTEIEPSDVLIEGSRLIPFIKDDDTKEIIYIDHKFCPFTLILFGSVLEILDYSSPYKNIKYKWENACEDLIGNVLSGKIDDITKNSYNRDKWMSLINFK